MLYTEEYKAKKRISRMEYYYRNRELELSRSKKYNQTEKGKISHFLTVKKWRLDNPEKFKAYSIVNGAIRSGKIEKGCCQICGLTGNVHAHHEDYSKPLEIIWLCPKHHKNVHCGIMEV